MAKPRKSAIIQLLKIIITTQIIYDAALETGMIKIEEAGC